MPSACHSLKQQYESLKTLNDEFVLACEKAGDPRAFSADQLRTLQIQKQKIERFRDVFIEKIRFISIEEAKDIMSAENVFGPEALKQTFDISLDPKDIPPIRFRAAELKVAKECGEYLVLRVNKDKNGNPLTAKVMCEAYSDGGVNEELIGRFENEPFYTTETPRHEWALISSRIFEESKGGSVLEQTDILVEEIERIYEGIPMPGKYQDAVREFHTEKDVIENLLESGTMTDDELKSAAKRIINLSINQLLRQRFSEALFDTIVVWGRGNGNDLFEDAPSCVCTSSEFLSGNLVSYGIRYDVNEYPHAACDEILHPYWSTDDDIGSILSRIRV